MTLTHVIKVNDKIFTIVSQPKDAHKVLTCPDGHVCHLTANYRKIFHRDCEGKVQVEPVLRF